MNLTPSIPTVRSTRRRTDLEGIVEHYNGGLLVLAPAQRAPMRRVLFVNSYGGPCLWERIKSGEMPGHHLWGCLELVRMGYEVGVAAPLPHFDIRRSSLTHDIPLLRVARNWLRPSDILYSGHTLLYWIPLLKLLGLPQCRIVSVAYARETLDFAKSHDGIIALTPAAADQARRDAPGVKVAHLSWGSDLAFFPPTEYNPEWHFSCGITHRDIQTLRAAAQICSTAVRVITSRQHASGWSKNTHVISNRIGSTLEQAEIPYQELIHEHYDRAIASLIVLKRDPDEETAVGFTNLLEAMALARPVIVTRTGALPGEIDVEAVGCGLHVPPHDPGALADAMNALAGDPQRSYAMGQRGRWLAESHYNINRYARQLHSFFEQL